MDGVLEVPLLTIEQLGSFGMIDNLDFLRDQILRNDNEYFNYVPAGNNQFFMYQVYDDGSQELLFKIQLDDYKMLPSGD